MTLEGMRFEDGRIQVEGFPTAVKLAQIEGEDAKRLSHLLLHRQDLEFAHQCATALQLPEIQVPVIRQALWRSAIVAWSKCFGTSHAGRFRLLKEDIYPAPEADAVFRHFKALRDKHIAHDENAFAQAKPGVVIGPEDGEKKILQAVCFGMFVQTENGGTDLENLQHLIGDAMKWVLNEVDTVGDKIAATLEHWDYQRLLALPDVQFKPPNVTDVGKRRRG